MATDAPARGCRANAGHIGLGPATQQGHLDNDCPFGVPQWTRDDPVNMVRVDVSPDGGIVVGGTPSAGSFGVACLKCVTDGTPLWANRDADGPAKAFLLHGQMRLARDENVDAARARPKPSAWRSMGAKPPTGRPGPASARERPVSIASGRCTAAMHFIVTADWIALIVC